MPWASRLPPGLDKRRDALRLIRCRPKKKNAPQRIAVWLTVNKACRVITGDYLDLWKVTQVTQKLISGSEEAEQPEQPAIFANLRHRSHGFRPDRRRRRRRRRTAMLHLPVVSSARVSQQLGQQQSLCMDRMCTRLLFIVSPLELKQQRVAQASISQYL